MPICEAGALKRWESPHPSLYVVNRPFICYVVLPSICRMPTVNYGKTMQIFKVRGDVTRYPHQELPGTAILMQGWISCQHSQHFEGILLPTADDMLNMFSHARIDPNTNKYIYNTHTHRYIRLLNKRLTDCNLNNEIVNIVVQHNHY